MKGEDDYDLPFGLLTMCHLSAKQLKCSSIESCGQFYDKC